MAARLNGRAYPIGKEIFMAYMPQAAEATRHMSAEEYASWKSETYGSTPEAAMESMEKMSVVTGYLVLA